MCNVRNELIAVGLIRVKFRKSIDNDIADMLT